VIGSWWVADLWEQDQALLVSWLFWIIFAICLHELAHGWTAIRLGDETPRLTGHMTWNPIVHMGPFSLVALLLLGFAWGAMPVNPSRLRGRHGDAIVSFAGPAMNLSLAVTSAFGVALWRLLAPIQDPLYTNVASFFSVGVWLNLLLAMFNLFPVPPLDGSRILASYWRGYDRFVGGEHGPPFAIMGFIGAIVITNTFLFRVAWTLEDLLVGVIMSVLT